MTRFFSVLSIIYTVFGWNGANAYPNGAPHCGPGDLAGKGSPHGEFGRGSLNSGYLQVSFDSMVVQPWSPAPIPLIVDQQYTVTLDFSLGLSSLFFRGFLFRLGGKNDEDASETFSVGGDPNARLNTLCADGISGITHTNRNDKTSVSFNFMYTGSAGDELVLDVTVLKSHEIINSNDWFYSEFSFVMEEGQALTATPSVHPSASPSNSVFEAISPSSVPSPFTSSCVDSLFKFRVKRRSDGKKVFKNCSWAAQKLERCNWGNTSSHCPLTCSACNTCIDAKGKFKFYLDPEMVSKMKRNCGWVSRDPVARCEIPHMKRACRETCGWCDMFLT